MPDKNWKPSDRHSLLSAGVSEKLVDEMMEKVVVEETTPPKPIMNKTEAEYARILDARCLDWEFESLKFRIGKAGKRCWYTPDFLVVVSSQGDCGHDNLEIHEVKGGFIRDDARVKLEAAARLYPQFRWIMAQKIVGKWKVVEI